MALTEKDIVRFWSKVDKNGPLPDQSNPHYAGLDRCWVWTGAKFRRGYGQFKAIGKKLKSHRITWVWSNGAIPQDGSVYGASVLHRCDNPSCCNPDHLFLGDQKDNAADMVAKGRQSKGDSHFSRTKPECLARGDRNGSRTKPECLRRGANHPAALHPERMPRGEAQWLTHLTDDIVIQMREIYAAGGITQKMLGERFGIRQAAVSCIIRRETWAHIPPTNHDWI